MHPDVQFRQLISSDQYTRENLGELFHLAKLAKTGPEIFRKSLKKRIVTFYFAEPSTRTKGSFFYAVNNLGGTVMDVNDETSSSRKGERFEDMMTMLALYAKTAPSGLVLRHSDPEASVKAAEIFRRNEVFDHMLINAGNGSGEHPTQTAVDVFTIMEHREKTSGRPDLDGLKILMVGDLKNGRTVHSLAKTVSLYKGVEISALSIPELRLPEEYRALLSKRGVFLREYSDFSEVPCGALDVVYQTRHQKERDGNAASGPSADFTIDASVMKRFRPDAILMHPLPRNGEIAKEVDADPRAHYFKQAENGVYARMALMHYMVGGAGKAKTASLALRRSREKGRD